MIGLATDGQLERLARLMTVENFKGFALLVNFEPADVAEWETESGGDVRLSALKMLKTWKVRGNGKIRFIVYYLFFRSWK